MRIDETHKMYEEDENEIEILDIAINGESKFSIDGGEIEDLYLCTGYCRLFRYY